MDSHKVNIIAHRGASYIAPENTRAAFEAAFELDADGFETDVQLTGDGKLVIHHNYTIDANSDGQGLISEMTVDALKQYDFGSWKGASFKGEHILTLDECLREGQKFRLINVELKAPMNREISYVKPVADAIKKSGIQDKIIISAFDHNLLREMKEYLPEVRVGALTSVLTEKMIDMMRKTETLLPDMPLHRIDFSKMEFPSNSAEMISSLGIPGADAPKVFAEFIQSMSATYPGKTFKEIESTMLAQQDLASYVKSLDFALDYLHCQYQSCFLNPSLVPEMHAMGIGVNPWTVDEEEDMKKLIDLKVDGIITNRPDLLLKLV